MIFGAYAKSGTATSNFITVNEGAEATSVIGAKSDNGDGFHTITVDVAGHAGKNCRW